MAAASKPATALGLGSFPQCMHDRSMVEADRSGDRAGAEAFIREALAHGPPSMDERDGTGRSHDVRWFDAVGCSGFRSIALDPGGGRCGADHNESMKLCSRCVR